LKRIVFIILSINIIYAKNVKPKFYTPSFNCLKFDKENSVEYKICTNKKLSKLDFKMSELYHKVGKFQIAKKYSPIFINQQREWLKTRDSCSDNNCLNKRYKEKINSLKKMQNLRYKIIFNSEKKICNKLKKIFNDDLKESDKIEIFNPFNIKNYQKQSHSEFKSIEWKDDKDGKKISYFDINNDGKEDKILFFSSDELYGKIYHLKINNLRIDNGVNSNHILIDEKNIVAILKNSFPSQQSQIINPKLCYPHYDTINMPIIYIAKIQNRYYIMLSSFIQTDFKTLGKIEDRLNNGNIILLLELKRTTLKTVCLFQKN